MRTAPVLDDVCFKVAEDNLLRYEEAGAEKHGKMPYYSLPGAVRDNPSLLQEWARSSIRVAHAKKTGS